VARPLRPLVPGGLYHVTTRGIRRLPIFDDDDDRREYLTLLAEVVRMYEWSCLSFCLMPNHVHLLMQTPNPDLNRGMHDLNHWYAVRYNGRNNFTGHLFERRYWSRLITDDASLPAVARYVVRNPRRAGICEDIAAYPWSSYRASLEPGIAPRFLDVAGLHEIFGSIAELRAYVERDDLPDWPF
jgi:REP element-mobilizing transposase RayT